MDTVVADPIRTTITDIGDRFGYEMNRVLVFGSRARGDHDSESDIDIIVVSADFEGVPFYKRSRPFYRHWNYDELPSPEFVCLTPTEFQERADATHPTLVHTAIDEGVDLIQPAR